MRLTRASGASSRSDGGARPAGAWPACSPGWPERPRRWFVGHGQRCANAAAGADAQGALRRDFFLLDLPDAARAAHHLDLQLRRAAPAMRSHWRCWWIRTDMASPAPELEQIVVRPMHLGFGAHRDFSEGGPDRAPAKRSLYRCRRRQRGRWMPQAVGQQRPRQACLQVAGCNENRLRGNETRQRVTKQRKSSLGQGVCPTVACSCRHLGPSSATTQLLWAFPSARRDHQLWQ